MLCFSWWALLPKAVEQVAVLFICMKTGIPSLDGLPRSLSKTWKPAGKRTSISLSKINTVPLMSSLGIQACVSRTFGVGSFFLKPRDDVNLLAPFWEGSWFMATRVSPAGAQVSGGAGWRPDGGPSAGVAQTGAIPAG